MYYFYNQETTKHGITAYLVTMATHANRLNSVRKLWLGHYTQLNLHQVRSSDIQRKIQILSNVYRGNRN